MGRRHASRRVGPRARRVPPVSADGVGDRLRHGVDAILLARRRFEVTAVDCSPIALEQARLRAEQQDALIHFVLADIFEFARSAGQFDLVYDCGAYHAIRQVHLERYLEVLWRVLGPVRTTYVWRAPRATVDEGPPQVTEDEIHNELGRLFEFVHLRPTRLESLTRSDGYPAWSCLLRRPTVGGK